MENTNEQTASNEAVIEVFTEEQLNILPQETKDSVVFLEKNLPAKEVKLFNPLVAALLDLKKLETLEYLPDNKECIAKYKDAKKQITAFKKLAGDTKSAIKKPMDLIGKEILAIEKGVKIIAESVLTKLETTFDEYEKAEEKRKQLLADKKREKDQEVINNLTAEQQQQKDQMEKTNMLNNIKHEKSLPWETKVNEALDTYSKEALETLLAQVAEANSSPAFVNLRKEAAPLIERQILSDEEYVAACNMYQTKMNGLASRIQDKIALFTTQDNLKVMETREETIKDFGNIPVASQLSPAEQFAAGPQPTSIEPMANIPTQEKATEAVLQTLEAAGQVISDFTDVPFFIKDDSVAAGVNIAKEISFMATKIYIIRQQYMALYTEAQKRPGIEEQYAEMKKLSAGIVLLGKTYEYLNGGAAEPQLKENQNQ